MSFGLCPADFQETSNNVCFKGFLKSSSFCQANELCEEEGSKRELRLHLPGVNSAQIPTKLLNSHNIFTSITALLNRSAILVDGWQFGDPGYSGYFIDNNIQQLPWATTYPSYATQALTIYQKGDFIDGVQNQLLASYVVCELSNRPVPGPVEMFHRDWPFKFQFMFITTSETVGCFTNHPSDSLLKCAKE
ncbi:hypothetical protein FBUS_06971 [Fasciolopsis buskii]|uniref:Uncharacterized protein n=1 Tax=Fasciolopsis buskii TaxID=27845 RepID=A0A8E0RLT3_9TREM|nr:hypothetical protein FBUS_06971 [Fasciolopsis buski]